MDTKDIITAAGGPTAVGRKLGVSHSSVIDWRKTGRIPVGHVLKMEEITGISRHQLRPDIYGPLASQPGAMPDTAHDNRTPDPGVPEAEPPYGSTEWLIARRKERPTITINSVDLLNSMYDEE